MKDGIDRRLFYFVCATGILVGVVLVLISQLPKP